MKQAKSLEADMHQQQLYTPDKSSIEMIRLLSLDKEKGASQIKRNEFEQDLFKDEKV